MRLALIALLVLGLSSEELPFCHPERCKIEHEECLEKTQGDYDHCDLMEDVCQTEQTQWKCGESPR